MLESSADINDLGGVNWHLCASMVAAWAFTFLCLYKGIKTSGRVVYVTALIPYLFLFILVARGVTLPGAEIGLKFYLRPEWERLRSPTVSYGASQCSSPLFTYLKICNCYPVDLDKSCSAGVLLAWSGLGWSHHNVFLQPL